MKRAALLIGLDNAPRFPPLKAAVSGAKSVSGWLAAEGYQTTLLTDQSDGAITVNDVKLALKSILGNGDTEKLVVYFAGHGLLNGLSELWLLSSAATDVDEVIDVSRNVEAARTCGVKSVVFISDACRLLPGTVFQSRTSGAMIFPAMNDYSVDVEVDRFFATRPGMAALEIASAQGSESWERERYVGIFTEALRDIHIDPDATLIGPVTIEGEATVAVLSRKLKTSLAHVVDGRAQDKSLSLRQQPQLVLECGAATSLSLQFQKVVSSQDLTHNSTGIL
ncbi:caspase family protein [Rhizobium ruizarguesonis]